jgi:hypothetical protein
VSREGGNSLPCASLPRGAKRAVSMRPIEAACSSWMAAMAPRAKTVIRRRRAACKERQREPHEGEYPCLLSHYALRFDSLHGPTIAPLTVGRTSHSALCTRQFTALSYHHGLRYRFPRHRRPLPRLPLGGRPCPGPGSLWKRWNDARDAGTGRRRRPPPARLEGLPCGHGLRHMSGWALRNQKRAPEAVALMEPLWRERPTDRGIAEA